MIRIVSVTMSRFEVSSDPDRPFFDGPEPYDDRPYRGEAYDSYRDDAPYRADPPFGEDPYRAGSRADLPFGDDEAPEPRSRGLRVARTAAIAVVVLALFGGAVYAGSRVF